MFVKLKLNILIYIFKYNLINLNFYSKNRFVQYKYFCLKIFKGILIPRVETEHLINIFNVMFFKKCCKSFLDLGSGSGFISIFLSKKFLNSFINSIDKSFKNLNSIKQNAFYVNIFNVNIFYSNWFENILNNYKFNFIISNPPYLSFDDLYYYYNNINIEAKYFFYSKNLGLFDLLYIIVLSKKFLFINGFLILEHGYNQSKIIRYIFLCNGFINLHTYLDFTKLNRITISEN